MDTQFLNRSNKKREKIFRDRVSKAIEKLLLGLSSHAEYNLSEQEQAQLTKTIVNLIVQKAKNNADQIIKSPSEEILSMEELVTHIVKSVRVS